MDMCQMSSLLPIGFKIYAVLWMKINLYLDMVWFDQVIDGLNQPGTTSYHGYMW